MAVISGDTLDGVSATTLWTLHNRGTEAKRPDGVIRDQWAVTLFDAISYDYLKFGKPNQSHGSAGGRIRRGDAGLPRRTPEGIGRGPRRRTADQLLALDDAGCADELTWYSSRSATGHGVCATNC